MDSGTLAYETTRWPGQRGFPSSLERGRTRTRETRNGVQKLKQDEPPFPRATGPLLLHDIPTNYATNPDRLVYSLHCAFMHETSSRFWANFRPPSSVPPAIRLELLFRAINARRPRRQFGKVFRQDTVW